MHPDADELMKSRMAQSARAEGIVAAWLKRAGFYVLLTPEHDGEIAVADMYVKAELGGKTLSVLEVKSRNLSFYTPDTFPYDDVPLSTRDKYKSQADYVIFSNPTGVALVAASDRPRGSKLQSDNARGVAGMSRTSAKADLITFQEFIDELWRRANG